MPDNPFDPVAFMCIMACCFPFIPWLQLSVLTEAYRRKRNNDPKKLPKRRRRLSVPSRCVSNVDCAFLSRLPIELRLEIYTLVLGGKLLHIVQLPRKLAHRSCPSANEYGYRTCCQTTLRTNVQNSAPKARESLSSAGTAILQSCRQIYMEAIDLLYNSNVFDFDHLQTFVYFFKSIPSPRLATISTLHITWSVSHSNGSYGQAIDALNEWERFCHVVATKMSGLRHFKVFLSHNLPIHGLDIDGEDSVWIKPLLEIKGLRTFNLQLHDTGAGASTIMLGRSSEPSGYSSVQKLELCLREKMSERRDPPIPSSEPLDDLGRRRLWKPRKFPDPVVDLEGRMIQLSTAFASTNIETGSRDVSE